MGTQSVMVPTGTRSAPTVTAAKRPASLAGLRIGLLDHGKEFSDAVLDALSETLRRRYGATDIKIWRKGFPAKGAPFIAEMAADCDVAVRGVGHCGCCRPEMGVEPGNL